MGKKLTLDATPVPVRVDGLRAAGGVIRDGNGAGLAAGGGGSEGDGDGAVGAGGNG